MNSRQFYRPATDRRVAALLALLAILTAASAGRRADLGNCGEQIH